MKQQQQILVASFIALSALLAVPCQAGFGHSTNFRKQDDYGNYAFGYDIKNGHGAVNGRKESGGPHGVVGSYYIGDIDGRHRTVHYVADKLGFRAQIKTNEPGTKTSYTAGAAYSSANGPTAPSGAYGIHGAAHFAAPVFAKAPVAYGHGHHGLGHFGVAHHVHHGNHFRGHFAVPHFGRHFGGHVGHFGVAAPFAHHGAPYYG